MNVTRQFYFYNVPSFFSVLSFVSTGRTGS